MNGDPEMVICNRVGTCVYVAPGSIDGTCGECSHAVHLAPSSQGALAKWPALRVLCLECGGRILDERGTGVDLAIAPGQRAELRAAGVPLSFVRDIIEQGRRRGR